MILQSTVSSFSDENLIETTKLVVEYRVYLKKSEIANKHANFISTLLFGQKLLKTMVMISHLYIPCAVKQAKSLIR